MNIGEIQTQVAQALNAHDTRVMEEFDSLLFYAAARDAMREIQKKLRVPVSEKDIVLVSGERGINLPADFTHFIDEPSAVRIKPDGADSEGTIIMLVPESSFAE